jgi:hypothetical protein
MAGRDGQFSSEREHGVSRRRFLQAAAGSGAALVLSRFADPDSALAAAPPFNPNANPITRENRLTSGWTNQFQLGAGKYQSSLSGFATKTSVNAGEPLPIKLNVYNPLTPTTAELRVYRLGYYGGAGGRLAKTPVTGIPVNNQGFLAPTDDLGYNTAASAWSVSHTLDTSGLETGMYLIKVIAALPSGTPNETHIPFIVRADGRARDLLVVMPTNTWQAYNPWSGKSLYPYNSSADPTVIGPSPNYPAPEPYRAAKVSFDRPMSNMLADYNWVLRSEFPLIWWLERQGYNLAYTDDYGMHSQPAELRRPLTKTVAIAGHSEYWSSQMRTNLEAARDAGTNIASFSANTAYWQVRFEDSGRSLVCFKTVQDSDVDTTGKNGVNDFGEGNIDRPGAIPANDPLGPDGAAGGGNDVPTNVTTTFRDPGTAVGQADAPDNLPAATRPFEGLGRVGPDRPENALFGVMYIGDDDNVSYPLQVPGGGGNGGEFGAHPAWRHTTIASGSGASIGTNLVGWEWDAIPKGGYYSRYVGRQPANVKRLAQTVPPTGVPGSDLAYLLDAGRDYGSSPGGQGAEIHAVTYRASSGAQVFAAGTIQWSFGLGPHFEAFGGTTYEAQNPPVDSYTALNGVIQQATHNILYDGGVVPATAEGVIFDAQPAPPPGPPKTGPPVVTPRDTTGPALKLRGGRKRLLRGGRVKLRVTSSRSEPDKATGTVTLSALVTTGSGARRRKKRVRIGSRRFSLSPGRSRMVSIKLSRRGRRLLRRRGRLTLRADLEARDPAMNVTLKRAKVRLRRGSSG